MPVRIKTKGSFKKTDAFFTAMSKGDMFKNLAPYGRRGVDALQSATPVDSGLTADSWYYEVVVGKTSSSITWSNNNVVDGRPVAILLQYGHGTGTGGYISGRDFINPALRPIFDKIADDVWKVVTSA